VVVGEGRVSECENGRVQDVRGFPRQIAATGLGSESGFVRLRHAAIAAAGTAAVKPPERMSFDIHDGSGDEEIRGSGSATERSS